MRLTPNFVVKGAPYVAIHADYRNCGQKHEDGDDDTEGGYTIQLGGVGFAPSGWHRFAAVPADPAGPTQHQPRASQTDTGQTELRSHL